MSRYHRRSKSVASTNPEPENESAQKTPESPVAYLNETNLANNKSNSPDIRSPFVSAPTIALSRNLFPKLDNYDDGVSFDESAPNPPSLIPKKKKKKKSESSSSSSESSSESEEEDKIDLLNETKEQKKERKAKEKAEVDKLLKKQKKKINKCVACLIVPLGGLLLLKRVVESLF